MAAKEVMRYLCCQVPYVVVGSANGIPTPIRSIWYIPRPGTVALGIKVSPHPSLRWPGDVLAVEDLSEQLRRAGVPLGVLRQLQYDRSLQRMMTVLKRPKTDTYTDTLCRLPDETLQRAMQFCRLADTLSFRAVSRKPRECCLAVQTTSACLCRDHVQHLLVSEMDPARFAEEFDPNDYPLLSRLRLRLSNNDYPAMVRQPYAPLFTRAFEARAGTSFVVKVESCPRSLLDALFNHPRADNSYIFPQRRYDRVDGFWYPCTPISCGEDYTYGGPWCVDTLYADLRELWQRLHGNNNLSGAVETFNGTGFNGTSIMGLVRIHRVQHLRAQLVRLGEQPGNDNDVDNLYRRVIEAKGVDWSEHVNQEQERWEREQEYYRWFEDQENDQESWN